MELLSVKLLTVLALPPGINLWLALLGLVLMLRWRRLGAWLVTLGVLSLFVLSLPVVGRALLTAQEDYPALAPEQISRGEAEAIVVLAGGRYANAPEYGDDTLSRTSLVRVRYAVRLYRRTGLPLLLSGGSVFGNALPESFLMKEALVDDFRVPVTWTEEHSRNTAENARYSAAILRTEGIRRFYLVTDASHMARAVRAFRREGMEPVAAPTAFTTHAAWRPGVFDWLPGRSGLAMSARAAYVFLGRVWYRLRY